MGGKPGDVGFWPCGGALIETEMSSSDGIAMARVGASGNVSSAVGIRGCGFVTERLVIRSKGSGGVGVALAGELRCALALGQASSVRPMTVDNGWTQLCPVLRGISEERLSFT